MKERSDKDPVKAEQQDSPSLSQRQRNTFWSYDAYQLDSTQKGPCKQYPHIQFHFLSLSSQMIETSSARCWCLPSRVAQHGKCSLRMWGVFQAKWHCTLGSSSSSIDAHIVHYPQLKDSRVEKTRGEVRRGQCKINVCERSWGKNAEEVLVANSPCSAAIIHHVSLIAEVQHPHPLNPGGNIH